MGERRAATQLVLDDRVVKPIVGRIQPHDGPNELPIWPLASTRRVVEGPALPGSRRKPLLCEPRCGRPPSTLQPLSASNCPPTSKSIVASGTPSGLSTI